MDNSKITYIQSGKYTCTNILNGCVKPFFKSNLAAWGKLPVFPNCSCIVTSLNVCLC